MARTQQRKRKERSKVAGPPEKRMKIRRGDTPLSKGYLLVDSKKCTGCGSCMLACSLVHEGKSDLSLASIQILDNAFGCYPDDIDMAICFQCPHPECYYACPESDEALCIDPKTGVRFIQEQNCTGCKMCIAACPFTPSRIGFNPDRKVSVKCDFCKQTPFWDKPGKQACVEVCPVKAIRFSAKKSPGYSGYRVNLRGEGWAKLALPTD
jgi:protein NrfC